MLIKIKSNDIEKSEKDNGITLVALVITVIIIIILATVTLNFTFGEDGIITKANQAKYMAELSTFQEELGLYKANKQISEEGFSAESITAGEGNLSYVTDDDLIKSALGDHLTHSFIESKELEWSKYSQSVSDWERQRYMNW